MAESCPTLFPLLLQTAGTMLHHVDEERLLLRQPFKSQQVLSTPHFHIGLCTTPNSGVEEEWRVLLPQESLVAAGQLVPLHQPRAWLAQAIQNNVPLYAIMPKSALIRQATCCHKGGADIVENFAARTTTLFSYVPSIAATSPPCIVQVNAVV